MNQRWVAGFTATVGLLLLAHGALDAYIIPSERALVVDPLNPHGTEEDIAWLRSVRPYMYLVAIQGIVLGAWALVSAAALFARWKGALPTLILGSGLLATSAVAAIVLMPTRWQLQGLWLMFCGVLWWETFRARSKNGSAI
jgi:hypothetical protein